VDDDYKNRQKRGFGRRIVFQIVESMLQISSGCYILFC
jgi:hypothetical protein